MHMLHTYFYFFFPWHVRMILRIYQFQITSKD